MTDALLAVHELAQKLIQCPSVTPAEAGTLDVLDAHLTALGFHVTRLPFGEGADKVDNLFARRGTSAPHFCFAGHSDVVPPGAVEAWQRDPFAAAIIDNHIIGRGAVDMKGAIACFAAALSNWLESNVDFTGSISMLITCDEEGPAIYGTRPVVEWLKQQGQMPDAVLVGEPTNPDQLGDVIKHGRRGSLSCELTVYGEQGHVAYPHLANNPLHRLLMMLAPLKTGVLDKGNDIFDPTTAAITSIDTGNPATNVIPATCKARFNIRFGTAQTAAGLEDMLRAHFDQIGGEYVAAFRLSAEPFVTPKGDFSDLVAHAIHDVTGIKPALSTSGGTSDARFFAPYTEVLEFGLVGKTMHKIDEAVSLSDLSQLTKIYHNILNSYFHVSA